MGLFRGTWTCRDGQKNVETNMVAPGHVAMAGKMLKNDGGTWTYRDVQKMLQNYREASIWVERGPATRRTQKQTIRNSAFSGEYTIHYDIYSNINFKLSVSQAVGPMYMVTTLSFLFYCKSFFKPMYKSIPRLHKKRLLLHLVSGNTSTPNLC